MLLFFPISPKSFSPLSKTYRAIIEKTGNKTNKRAVGYDVSSVFDDNYRTSTLAKIARLAHLTKVKKWGENMTYQWDKEVDIIVVGSGAGGMVSALAAVQNQADVMIIEKAKLWGGSSATSGGGIWVPGSDVAKAAGFDDDLDGAYRYIRGQSADNVPDQNIRAFIDNAAPVLRWLMDSTIVDYMAFPYPDYRAECDGGHPQVFAHICPCR